MKPLQNQYQDLLEGKMSKFNFLNNIKRSLPNLVSNVTSLDDAVKILKSKRILSEVQEAKEVFSPADENALEKIVSKYVKDSDDIEKEMEAYHSQGYQGFSDMLKANLSRDEDFQTWTEYTKDQEQYKREMGEGEEETSEEDLAQIKKHEEEEDAKHTLPGGHLREDVDINAKLVSDIDKVNPLEYNTGIDYELDLSGDFSAEGLEKAVKKVLKNLAKDQIYYTNLKAELTSKINKKEVEAAKSVEVKNDNHTDKLNNLKTLVKKELANTKTTLGKQEKVTRANPEGVKLMKEERDIEARYNEYVGKLSHGTKANIEKQWKDAGDDMVKKHRVVVRAKELAKIREYVSDQLKKEAVKFTIGQTGQEHEYKNPKDAPEFEKDLKAAGVKYTKSNV